MEFFSLRDRLIRTYYWATPVFILLDVLLRVNIRATAFAGQPGLKGLYYAFCLLCGGLIVWKPRATRGVGLVESAVNMTALCVGLLLPLYSAADFIEGGVPAELISGKKIVNFLMSFSICLVSFYGGLPSAFSRRPR